MKRALKAGLIVLGLFLLLCASFLGSYFIVMALS